MVVGRLPTTAGWQPALPGILCGAHDNICTDEEADHN